MPIPYTCRAHVLFYPLVKALKAMSTIDRSWSLENSEEVAARNPYTFYKPSRAVVAMLAPGNQVKLIFTFESEDPEAPRAERMWVTIDSISNSAYVGTLDNEPRHIVDLKIGDRIEFDDRHIVDTDLTDPVASIVDKYAARCFATHRVMHDGCRVGYLYREQSKGDEDSGWRIMAGDEPQEYMNDSKNVAFVSLGAVLREDDSIIELLNAPVGSAFQRNAESGEFESVAQRGD